MKVLSFTPVLALAVLASTATAPAATGRSVLPPGVVASAAHIAGARDIGPLSASVPVHLAVGLRLRNESGLKQLVASQRLAGGPLYHHYLTPSQLRDSFGATQADYTHTVTLLRLAGFHIDRLDPLRMIIDISAPSTVVARYFSTTFHAITMPGLRGIGYMNVSPARMPAALAATAIGVNGFSKGILFKSAVSARAASHHVSQDSSRVRTDANTIPAYGPDGGYGPLLTTGAFDFPSRHGYYGKTASAGDIVDGRFSDTPDISHYLSYFDVHRFGGPTIFYNIDGGCTIGTCFDNFQAVIDAQQIIGTAPGVSYQVYVLPSGFGFGNIVDAIDFTQVPPVTDVVNFSFAYCESNETTLVYDSQYQAGAAEGITYEDVSFNGSHACGATGYPTVQAPADSPNALAVGGADSFTDLFGNVTSPPIADPNSGGGISTLFPEPSYQMGIPGTVSGGRNMPDIAGPAAINTRGPAIYCSSGTCGFSGWFGGTPFINNAPIAGAIAEVDGGLHAGIGFVNPGLYGLVKAYGWGPSSAPLFRDITIGCNGFGGYPPYCAGPGYDLVTGLGAPDFWNIIEQALAAR